MPNGRKSMDNMTWQEFQAWQRWNEFPERSDNPPLTVDPCFFYEGKEYYIIEHYGKYHIFNGKWVSLFSHENFLILLTTPIPLFHNKSFADVCSELDFD